MRCATNRPKPKRRCAAAAAAAIFVQKSSGLIVNPLSRGHNGGGGGCGGSGCGGRGTYPTQTAKLINPNARAFPRRDNGGVQKQYYNIYRVARDATNHESYTETISSKFNFD